MEKEPLEELLEILRARGVVTSGIKQSVLDEYKFMCERGECVELVWASKTKAAAKRPAPEPDAAE